MWITQNFVTEKYWLYILWLLVFFGLFWILNFSWYDSNSSFFLLTVFSLFLRWISYFIPYEDGKTLFMHSFLFLGVASRANHLLTLGGSGIFRLIGETIAFWTIWFWIVYYGLWYFTEVEKKHYYHFLYLAILFGLFIVLNTSERLLLMFNVDLLLYAWILALTTYIPIFAATAPTWQKQLSLRRVLAGEKILVRGETDSLAGIKSFFQWFAKLPEYLPYGLEYLNVILLIGLLASYLIPLFQGQLVGQLRYRTGILLFLFNTFLLKKNQIFTLVSRSFDYQLFSLYFTDACHKWGRKYDITINSTKYLLWTTDSLHYQSKYQKISKKSWPYLLAFNNSCCDALKYCTLAKIRDLWTAGILFDFLLSWSSRDNFILCTLSN